MRLCKDCKWVLNKNETGNFRENAWRCLSPKGPVSPLTGILKGISAEVSRIIYCKPNGDWFEPKED